MEKWVIAAKRADFNQIGQQFHIDPVIARLIRNRDVIGEDKIGRASCRERVYVLV